MSASTPAEGQGSGPGKQPARIVGMFDAIAGRYDLLNHLLSGGSDFYWRWRGARALRLTPADVVLDLCTGTCDFALESLRRGVRRVIGVDFAAEMLEVGRRKLARRNLRARAPLVRGDAVAIPLADRSVDAITVAFGIRNVVDTSGALREMHRVLNPGGRVAVLEFAMPRTPGIRQVYGWYFRNVLPRIGRVISRHADAYSYLPASVGAYFGPDEFAALLRAAGFETVRAVPLTFGVVYLYVASRGR